MLGLSSTWTIRSNVFWTLKPFIYSLRGSKGTNSSLILLLMVAKVIFSVLKAYINDKRYVFDQFVCINYLFVLHILKFLDLDVLPKSL